MVFNLLQDKKLLKYQLSLDLFGQVEPFEKNQTALDEYEKALTVYKTEFEDFLVKNKTWAERDELDEFTEEEMKDKEAVEQPEEPLAPVRPEISSYELSSVGRVYFNLTKVNAPERWRRIINQEFGIKKSNMQIWWELHEKHEEDLVKLDPYEDDDEEILEKADKKPKKSKVRFYQI